MTMDDDDDHPSSGDDLRAAIESAVRETEPQDNRSAPADAPAAERRAVERQRDESGRFAPKAAEQPPGATKEPEAAPQQPEGTANAATRRAPVSWRPENQTAFATLSPAIQEEILKREADITKGLQHQAPKVRAYEELERVIAPHQESLARRNLSPVQAINILLDVQRQFDRDPRDAWLRLGAQFGFVPGGTPQQAAPQQRQQVPQQPPGPPIDHVVEQKVQTVLQRQAIQQEIEAFARDPANRHYETLKPAMRDLIMAGRAQSIQDAYNAAAWLDPTIREQLIAERAASAVAQAQSATDQARVARAKQASGSIRGAPNGTMPAQAERSLREEIAAHYR